MHPRNTALFVSVAKTTPPKKKPSIFNKQQGKINEPPTPSGGHTQVEPENFPLPTTGICDPSPPGTYLIHQVFLG